MTDQIVPPSETETFVDVLAYRKVIALLRERRVELEVSQEELASQMHVNKSTINSWEQGEYAPRVPDLLLWARLLQLRLMISPEIDVGG